MILEISWTGREYKVRDLRNALLEGTQIVRPSRAMKEVLCGLSEKL